FYYDPPEGQPPSSPDRPPRQNRPESQPEQARGRAEPPRDLSALSREAHAALNKTGAELRDLGSADQIAEQLMRDGLPGQTAVVLEYIDGMDRARTLVYDGRRVVEVRDPNTDDGMIHEFVPGSGAAEQTRALVYSPVEAADRVEAEQALGRLLGRDDSDRFPEHFPGGIPDRPTRAATALDFDPPRTIDGPLQENEWSTLAKLYPNEVSGSRGAPQSARAQAREVWGDRYFPQEPVAAPETPAAYLARHADVAIAMHSDTYRAGEYDGVHGWVNQEGVLRFQIRAAEGTPSGQQMFRDLMAVIGPDVRAIHEPWSADDEFTDNLDTFNASRQDLLSPEDSARQTFTGKMAIAMGFTEVTVNHLVGPVGEHLIVDVTFSRPTDPPTDSPSVARTPPKSYTASPDDALDLPRGRTSRAHSAPVVLSPWTKRGSLIEGPLVFNTPPGGTPGVGAHPQASAAKAPNERADLEADSAVHGSEADPVTDQPTAVPGAVTPSHRAETESVPSAIQELLNRITDTAAHAEIEMRVLEQYQGYLRARERSIYREFLNNRKSDLLRKGTPAETVESLAEQQADEFIQTDRARDMFTRAAVQNTLQWVQNAKIPLLLDDATASPPDGSTAHRDAEPTVETDPPLPEALRTILAEIDSAGADPTVAEQAKNLVLAQYQKYQQVPEASVYRDSVAKRAADLAQYGVPAAEAEARAHQEADAFMLTTKARRMVDGVAANNTNQWVARIRAHAERQNSNLVDLLAEIYRVEPRPSAVPPVVAPPAPASPPRTPPAAASPLSASPPPAKRPKPQDLTEILARIDRAGADSVATEQAENLVRERYEEYLPVRQAVVHREYMEQQKAALLGKGVPAADAERRARDNADAFLRSERGLRAVSRIATSSVNQLVDTVQERAEQANSNFIDWLARMYREAHGIPSEPVAGLTRAQRALIDFIDTVRGELTAAETRLAALLERHPDLEDNGAHYWLTAFRSQRKALTELSLHYSEGKTAGGRPVTSRTDTSDVEGHRALVRGLIGEIQLAEQFDQIDVVCLRAEAEMPMGPRIDAEIDVVTDGNRVWREAKTNSINGQASKAADFDAQARRQLHITYMNRAYWVDGAPPQIKWHFMNGVNPSVKALLDAIRIEDESGRTVPDHHIEVIDGSAAGRSGRSRGGRRHGRKKAASEPLSGPTESPADTAAESVDASVAHVEVSEGEMYVLALVAGGSEGSLGAVLGMTPAQVNRLLAQLADKVGSESSVRVASRRDESSGNTEASQQDFQLSPVQLETLRALVEDLPDQAADGIIDVPPETVRAFRSHVATQVPTALSKRESEVLGLIAQGMSPAEIAAHLGLSPNTVNGYIARAKVKLHTTGMSSTVATARQHGYVGETDPPRTAAPDAAENSENDSESTSSDTSPTPAETRSADTPVRARSTGLPDGNEALNGHKLPEVDAEDGRPPGGGRPGPGIPPGPGESYVGGVDPAVLD
ncbi:helix-turn-helix transcriptional regulator, partial [Nocardia sp. NPDC004604]|uniref:helix-turn-helix transcriptional regulator n=1 Tax=Nocardia sp. NPDC004604 TaxID=3157013 RepID=UPI0033B50145